MQSKSTVSVIEQEKERDRGNNHSSYLGVGNLFSDKPFIVIDNLAKEPPCEVPVCFP